MSNPFDTAPSGSTLENAPKQPAVISRIPHYYGDAVRTIFLVCGSSMLVGLAVFASKLPAGMTISLISVMALVIAAGLTTPKRRVTIAADAALSVSAAAAFAVTATREYAASGMSGFYLFNQALALGFALALYLSVKTYRSMHAARFHA
jgi:hypothetical protein